MYKVMMLLALVSGPASATKFYDEAYTAGFRPRAAYQNLKTKYGVDVLRPGAHVRDFMLGQPLDDALKAWPVPLVLSDREYDFIKRGVVQRARVLKEFLYDLVSGPQLIFKHLNEVERATIVHAFDQEGISLAFLRRAYRGMPKSKIRFLYGPDLIRDVEGRWMVLEDNVGPVGGFGDSDFLRERYLQTAGLDKELTDVIGGALAAFMDEIGGRPEQAMAVLESTPPRLGGSDHERERLIHAFLAQGIPVNTVPDVSRIRAESWADRRIGFYLGAWSRLNFPTLVEICVDFAERRREFFTTPGIDAIGDKAFLPLMPRLAEFYLREKLILDSPPTTLLTMGNDLFESIGALGGKDLVLKKTSGRGGQDVHFLESMDAETLPAMVGLIEHEGYRSLVKHGLALPSYVAQARVEPSRLTFGDGPRGLRGSIDLRPITYVGPTRVTPPVQPWGRVTTQFGNPRHNVSQGALELVVLTACEIQLVR